MKNFKILLLTLPFIMLTMMACNDEPEPDIDQELLPYIEQFIFEANERDYKDENGIPLDIENIGIEVKFINISDENVIGRCQRDENGVSQSIAIDPVFWRLSDELVKQYIMFHELGHCVLGRGHNSSADANNTCLSIMEPGTGEQCMSNYTTTTRDGLLDELFNF